MTDSTPLDNLETELDIEDALENDRIAEEYGEGLDDANPSGLTDLRAQVTAQLDAVRSNTARAMKLFDSPTTPTPPWMTNEGAD